MTPSCPTLSRRSVVVVIASAIVAGASALCVGACDLGSAAPRSLILVEASDPSRPAQAAWISARKVEFEGSHRRGVRVLRVDAASDAIELAARGEADVLLIPEGAATDRLEHFFASEHGRVVGIISVEEGRLKVIAVSAKQHPKVDPEGEVLANFFAKPPASSTAIPAK